MLTAGRTLADLPVELALPSLFVIIVYWMGGLRATAGKGGLEWFSCSINLLVLNCASYRQSQGLGMYCMV